MKTLLIAAILIGSATVVQAQEIVVDNRTRTLTYTSLEGARFEFPVAVGRPAAQWRGTARVTRVQWGPTWRPTPNMRAKNPRLPSVVGPGPRNPLGTVAIYLDRGYYRIHGTNAPTSIGQAASSGCFRMHNRDAEALARIVRPGTRVVVR